MKKTFYSNGKLLLTGEYLVLDGGQALALPTQLGQSLAVTSTDSAALHWKSLDNQGRIWYQGHFRLTDTGVFASLQKAPGDKVGDQLAKLLNTCLQLNPGFGDNVVGTAVETKLDFPRDWGLGSSSTLINNLAQWAGVDPFKLLDKGFGGSGYDIACAFNKSPISYKNQPDGSRKIEPVTLDWPFTEQLYFVHLNKKMDSKLGIKHYRAQKPPSAGHMKRLRQLNEQLIAAATRTDFDQLLKAHDALIAEVLNKRPVQAELFTDYKLGAIKSLGAWGGDFVLATGGEQLPEYFKSKGYKTVIPFSKMRIKKPQR